MPDPIPGKVSRREFIKLVSLVAASGTLAACGVDATAIPHPTESKDQIVPFLIDVPINIVSAQNLDPDSNEYKNLIGQQADLVTKGLPIDNQSGQITYTNQEGQVATGSLKNIAETIKFDDSNLTVDLESTSPASLPTQLTVGNEDLYINPVTVKVNNQSNPQEQGEMVFFVAKVNDQWRQVYLIDSRNSVVSTLSMPNLEGVSVGGLQPGSTKFAFPQTGEPVLFNILAIEGNGGMNFEMIMYAGAGPNQLVVQDKDSIKMGIAPENPLITVGKSETQDPLPPTPVPQPTNIPLFIFTDYKLSPTPTEQVKLPPYSQNIEFTNGTGVPTKDIALSDFDSAEPSDPTIKGAVDQIKKAFQKDPATKVYFDNETGVILIINDEIEVSGKKAVYYLGKVTKDDQGGTNTIITTLNSYNEHAGLSEDNRIMEFPNLADPTYINDAGRMNSMLAYMNDQSKQGNAVETSQIDPDQLPPAHIITIIGNNWDQPYMQKIINPEFIEPNFMERGRNIFQLSNTQQDGNFFFNINLMGEVNRDPDFEKQLLGYWVGPLVRNPQMSMMIEYLTREGVRTKGALTPELLKANELGGLGNSPWGIENIDMLMETPFEPIVAGSYIGWQSSTDFNANLDRYNPVNTTELFRVNIAEFTSNSS